MSGVRLTFEVLFSVSSTQADEKDLGNGEYSVRTDAAEEGGSWKTTVAAAASDLEIRLDNIANVIFLFLKLEPKEETDPIPEVTVKINDVANTPFTLKPPSDKKTGMMLLTTDGLTALYVSNGGTEDVKLTVVAAGD